MDKHKELININIKDHKIQNTKRAQKRPIMQVQYKCYITTSVTLTGKNCSVIRHRIIVHTRMFQYNMSKNTHHSGGSRPSGKQYRQFMQMLQDEAGTGRGSSGSICGHHRLITAMYLAARGALGAVEKSAISSAGNTTHPMPMDIISDDILCSNFTNCERI